MFSLTNWLSSKLGTAKRKSDQRRQPSTWGRAFRPILETLEHRITPANIVWEGDVSNLMNVAGNWAGGVLPGVNDTLVFDATADTFAVTNNFAANTTFQAIRFDAGGFTIDPASPPNGNTIRLTAGITNNAGVNVINTNVFLAASQNFNIIAGQVTMGGALSGAATSALTKLGAGTLTFSGANSYLGATTVSAGLLQLNDPTGGANPNAINGALTINGSTARVELLADNQILNTISVTISSGGILDLNNHAEQLAGLTLTNGNVDVDAGGNLTLTGNVTVNASATPSTIDGPGLLTLSGVRTFTVADGAAADDLVVSAQITGVSGLTKAGTGLMAVSGPNTFSGITSVTAGRLELRNNLGLGADTTAANRTIVSAGATVQLAAGVNVGNELLTIAGTTGGALRSLAGLNSWAGSITLVANSIIGVDAGELILTGLIAGAFGVTKVGTGTLQYAGTQHNTYSGATTVNEGVLKLNMPGLNALAATGALIIGDGIGGVNADQVVLLANDQLPNTKPITINSSGLLNLNGNDDTIGALTLVGGDIATGAGTLTLSGNVIANASTSVATIDGILDLGTLTRVFTVADGGADPDLLINAVVSGNATGLQGLTKAGLGKLTLTNANSYDGLTTVSAGTLEIQNNDALGDLAQGTTVTAGATLSLNGVVPLTVNEVLTINGTGVGAGGALRNQAGNNTYAGAITLQTASSIGVQAASQLTVSGVLKGAGAFTKTGPGTLVLSNANTYTGTTTVSQGILQVANAQGLGTGTNIAGNGTTVAAGAQLQLDNVNIGLELLTLNGAGPGGTGALQNLAGDNIWAGSVILATASTVNVAAPGDTLTFSNVLSGTGKLTKIGLGTLALTGGASNVNSGGVAVNDGILELAKTGAFTAIASALTIGDNVGAPSSAEVFYTAAAGTNQIGNTVAVTINSDGELDLNGKNDTTGALTLAGGTVNTGAGTLTLGGNITGLASATAATINGNLNLGAVTRTFTVADGAAAADLVVNAIISSGGVTKAGAGTLQLTNANTYAGLTTVSAGTLEIQHNLALGTVAAGTTVAAGATLLLNNAGALTITGEALTLNGTGVGGNGALRNQLGDNTWTGNIALPTTSTVGVDLVGEDLTLSGVLSGLGGLTKVGIGQLQFSGTAANTYTGVTTVNAGTLVLNKTAGLNAFNGALVIGDNLGGPQADTVVVAQSNQIPDLRTVTINSSGILTLGALQETIGALTLTGGGIDLQASNSVLTLSSNVVVNASTLAATIFSGGAGSTLNLGGAVRTFTVNNGTPDPDLSITAVITNGGITKAGVGSLLLDAVNTYAGVTTVSAGTLIAANSAALGTIAGGTSVTAGATLALQGGITINDALTLNGTGVSAGGALRNLADDNTYAGTINLLTASSLFVQTATQLTVSGIMSGAGTLTKIGTGILDVTNANTRTGATVVSAGTLLVNNVTGSGLGTGAVTVQNTATLGGDGSFSGALTVNSGGTVSPGAPGDGIGSLAVATAGGATIFQAGSTLHIDLNGAGSFDQLLVGNATTGALTVTNAALDLHLLTPALGTPLTIIDKLAGGAITGFFTGKAVPPGTFTEDGTTYTITYTGGAGTNNVLVTQTSQAAPAISGTVASQAVNDNTTINPFSTVVITDPDVGELLDVVVTVSNPANGTLAGAGWTEGPAGTYSFTPNSTAAAVTAAIQALVFTPTANQAAPGATVGTGFTITVTDTGSATDTDSLASVIATSINDAPVLDNSGTPALPAINEDISLAANGGISVLDLLATGAGGNPITDPDVGALEGIAIVSAVFTNGNWQFSTNGGGSWTDFSTAVPALSDDTALLLTADATELNKIRFVPNADFNGTATIDFRAWDRTTGTNATSGDANPNGGSTAFSTDVEQASITVNAVNDAPTVTAPTAVTSASNTFTFSGVNLISIADADLPAEVQVSLSVSAGVLSLSGTTGLVFNFVADGNGTPDGSDGTNDATMIFRGSITDINNALNGLVWNGAPSDTLNITVNDLGNTGTGGALTNTAGVAIG